MATKTLKAKFEPSLDSRHAVANIIAILESLTPQDRGYAASRITQLYGKKIETKETAKAEPKEKSPWKQEWETTQAFKDWSESKGTAISPTDYAELQRRAFAARDTIRTHYAPAAEKKAKTGTGTQ